MAVIEYTILAAFIGIPVGFIYGTIFGLMAFGEGGIKDGLVVFLGAQIGSPIFLAFATFVLMGFISILHPELNFN